MFKQLVVVSLLLSFTSAFAGVDFKLDPAPKNIRKVFNPKSIAHLEFPFLDAERVKNDLNLAIANQTPVKSQGRRGTCSIFSAVGEVESLLKTRFNKEFDLSENHLEFLVMSRMKNFPTEGSDTRVNIPAFAQYGALYEADWVYEPNSWENVSDLSSEEAKRVETVCGHLNGRKKAACLLSHLDPDDTRYDRKAESIRNELGLESLEIMPLYNTEEIKRYLDAGHPLVLGLEFYYGAWNHRKMEEFKIGTRDMKNWENGIVSTPTEKDVEISKQHEAGHSIVIVGYDDAKQVYYFKNSWGTDSFGVKSDLLGSEGTTKGYGSISYEYAHNYAEFIYVGFANLRQ